MCGFDNKVVLVTGSATLIGAGVLRAFHARGATVVGIDIDPRGEAIAREAGSEVIFMQADITDDVQVARCVADTVARFGGIDFLVNLACSYLDDGANASRRDWLDSYNVNVASAVMMARACRPEMIRR